MPKPLDDDTIITLLALMGVSVFNMAPASMPDKAYGVDYMPEDKRFRSSMTGWGNTPKIAARAFVSANNIKLEEPDE